MSCPYEALLRSGLRVQFGENLLGDVEGGVGGGDAAVDGGLQEDFADLVASDADVEGGSNVHAELVGTVERDHHRESDQAARLARQAGARPNLAPGIARDE